MYNKYMAGLWDEVRDFLSIHCKFDTRIDTPYWRRCCEETSLEGAQPLVEFYQQIGPSALAKALVIQSNSPFGLDGYYTLLVGQHVPHLRPHIPTAQEVTRWEAYRRKYQRAVAQALDIRQSLAAIRDPRWRWS